MMVGEARLCCYSQACCKLATSGEKGGTEAPSNLQEIGQCSQMTNAKGRGGAGQHAIPLWGGAACYSPTSQYWVAQSSREITSLRPALLLCKILSRNQNKAGHGHEGGSARYGLSEL